MKSGRVNSPESLATASAAFRAFKGSWKAIDEAAQRDPKTGVYVIRGPRSPQPESVNGKHR